jgi:hypothetical protein
MDQYELTLSFCMAAALVDISAGYLGEDSRRWYANTRAALERRQLVALDATILTERGHAYLAAARWHVEHNDQRAAA